MHSLRALHASFTTIVTTMDVLSQELIRPLFSRRALLGPLLALLALTVPAVADGKEPIRVVATIPDLADIARAVGGDRVAVTTICRGTENIHSVRIRPSHLIAVSKADVFLEMGLSLEHAWVPSLLETARNPRISPGTPGFVNVSAGWEAIQVPESLSRRDGVDIHPHGNPHFNLDPRGGEHMADHVLLALIDAAPDAEEAMRARHKEYVERITAQRARWEQIRGALQGKSVVMYHRDFDYFLSANGVRTAATIEPKPGLPPTPRHLASVIQTMRGEKVNVIVTANWSNNKSVGVVARESGARVVELPHMVGASKRATSWIAMMDELHEKLAAAFDVEL